MLRQAISDITLAHIHSRGLLPRMPNYVDAHKIIEMGVFKIYVHKRAPLISLTFNPVEVNYYLSHRLAQ